MNAQAVKTIAKEAVREVIKEEVTSHFAKIDEPFKGIDEQFKEVNKQFENVKKQFRNISKEFKVATETMKEFFASETRVFRDYVDMHNDKTSKRIDDLESKQKTTWDLVVLHDHKIESIK
jgi:phage-related minor tail protein